MPVGTSSFLTDPKNNVGTIASAGNVYTNEAFPIILASYHMSISAASGGTQLPNIPCGKIELQNLSGNHVMFIGGVDTNAPYSGRGNELPSMTNLQGFPDPHGEKLIYINNANQVSICSTFSGEMISFMAYGNGQNVIVDPNTQGSQPDNTPPVLSGTIPLSGSTNIPVNQIVTWQFDGPMDPNAMTISGLYVVTSGQVSPSTVGHLGGTVSYTAGNSFATFTPNSGQFMLNNWYVPMVDPSVDDSNGNFISGAPVSGGPFQIQGAPTLTTAPASGSINQAFNQAVVVSFSEAMNSTTVTTSGLYIVISGQSSPQTTGHLSGAVAYTSGQTTATITVNSGQYSLSGWYIPMGHITLQDPFGVPISQETSGSPFQIIGPPIISGWFPASGSTGASGLLSIIGTFNTNVASSTINTSGMFVVISGQSTPLTAGHFSGIVGINSSNNTQGIITVNSGQLVTSTWYIPFVTTEVTDQFGNAVTATISGAPFQTALSFPGDTTPPVVIGTTPTSGTAAADTSGILTVSFSKAMSSGTIVNASFVLRDTSAASNVTTSVSLFSDLQTAIMTPSASLALGHGFKFEISGAQDLNANNMTPFSGAPFTTELAMVISGTSPMSGQTNVDIGSAITITPSKAYQSGTVHSGTFQIKDIQAGIVNVPCAGVTMINTSTITFTPSSFLQLSHLHRIEVSGIRDVDGNLMTPHSGATFTTQPAVQISGIKPSSGTTSVSVTTVVSGVFSRAINTIDTTTFKILDGSGNTIGGSISLNSNNINFRFQPTSNLAYGSIYTYNISGVFDLAGESFMSPFSGATFTTTNPALTQFFNAYSGVSNQSLGGGASYIRVGETAGTSQSSLIPRVIKQAQFLLQRVGNPSGGDNTLYCRVRDSNDNIQTTLGSIPVSSLSTSYASYIFTNLNASFAIATGTKILVEFSGGNSSNYVNAVRNGNQPAGQSNVTYDVNYNTGYGSDPNSDVTAIFWY